MADTADMAPGRATAPRRTVAANGTRRTTRARKTDDLEAQVKSLQDDLKSITQTLGRMGETRMDEVKTSARAQARSLVDKGQSAIESAEDEFGQFEQQIKDKIREKPLTAVAGAIALGFVLAVVTR
jgi:ElaB/YqjD/DUF883 family membrane-anchored ribosome-binding protein